MLPSDPHSLSETLRTHGRVLQQLARDLIGDADLAQDLVQEACLRALVRSPRSRVSLPSWRATAVRRLALNEQRGRARRRRREEREARPEAQESPAHPLEGMEIARRLLEELRALREPYATVVWQRYYEGLEPDRIAERQGLPV
jgi:RNA polymerase sigma factor (sigma-70 family)